MTKPKATPALKLLHQFLSAAMSGGIDGAEMREAMEWVLERPNATDAGNPASKTDTCRCQEPQGYIRPQEPDSHDGHDYEGFIGGCQRMGCKAPTAAAENREGIAMKFPNIKVQPHWLAALERAKEEMPSCRWVCTAVRRGVEPEIGNEILDEIREAIHPWVFVSQWYFHETGQELTNYTDYRSAWLNHMVEQCRAVQETVQETE